MSVPGPAKLLSPPPRRSAGRKDFGDFQTPPALVAEVLGRLQSGGERFDRVFEPTCGVGHFLGAILGR